MSFDVRSRVFDSNQHILCEASAGTGKTFTIEHLFIRRLITSPKAKAEDFAVLTFTNAVAKELLVRLRRALDKAIDDVQKNNPERADYLIACPQEGLLDTLEAARDELEFATISTIHGFCLRALSEYESGAVGGRTVSFATPLEIGYYIEEFFRFGLDESIETCKELEIVLHAVCRDFSSLVEKLQEGLWDVKQEPRAIRQLAKLLEDALSGWTEDELKQQLIEATESYKGLRTRAKEVKDEVLAKIEAFASKDPLNMLKTPLFASKLFSDPKVHSSGEIAAVVALAHKLEPLLLELASPEAVFERIKAKCRRFVEHSLEVRNKFAVQELLVRTQKKLNDKEFVHFMKKRFSCVIVDEFQDTDPIQWHILKTLFVEDWQGFLYLVGDPKQSIYSFRGADVYCYMQAKQAQKHEVVQLTKNYRSSSALVAGLNQLFAGTSLFSLPKLGIHLEVPEIISGEKAENLISPSRGAIHLFQAEDGDEKHSFYPFIAKELAALKREGIAFSNMAVLVKDRFQAQELDRYLIKRGIPTQSWKKSNVIESGAKKFLERLVAALLRPKDRTQLIDLCMAAPFNYSSDKIVQLKGDLEYWAGHVTELLKLKIKFDESGLAGLVHAFLESVWPENAYTMKERAACDKQFLFDLELLVEACLEHGATLEALQDYISVLEVLPKQEKDELASRYDPQDEAVQILTLHASKGLEFDIVFALGLATRTPPADNDEKLRLFYVACTRAKRRLYLPVVKERTSKPIKPGTESPMELYRRALAERLTFSTTYLVEDFDESRLIAEKAVATTPLHFTPLQGLPARVELHSFTSQNEPLQLATSEIESSLPAGLEVGLLFHELLEDKKASDYLELTALDGHEQEVFALVERAQSVCLGSFTLCQTKQLKEVPFYTATHRGFIDLYFEHDEKWYLLDWKSNLLESYCKAALQKEIMAKGYLEQARLYTESVKRFATKPFGGFYFVFLRGLDDAETGGVMLLEPDGAWQHGRY